MDALGFALERFGPTGALRDHDGPHAIDDHATLPDGRTLDGVVDLKKVLLEDDSFTRCVAEKLLTYAIGRGPTDDDKRAIASLVKEWKGRKPSFEELIVGDEHDEGTAKGLLELDAFRRRRGESAGK
jgi:hypothetical protein